MSEGNCATPECGGTVVARGFCKRCYEARRRRGEFGDIGKMLPEHHGTLTGWRYGCRKRCCLDPHNAESRTYRQRHYTPRLDPASERKFLRLLKRSGSIPVAAEAVGLTPQAIRGEAIRRPAFGVKLEAARNAAD